MGMRDIKAAGGIAIVQEPRTAKYDSMPRSAIGTGSVDLVLAPKDIAKELPRICATRLAEDDARKADQTPREDDASLVRIFTLLRQQNGVDFTHYKLPTIRRRLSRRLVLHKLSSLPDYIKFLQKIPAEVAAL